MYGKKRIVLNKRNQIIVAGKSEGSKGGSWIPIGTYVKPTNSDGNIVAKFLRPENMFERKLTDDNSIKLCMNTIKEIRDVIRREYKIKK